MEPSLEQRLLRFLDREDIGQQRSEDDLRALPVDERVLEGECIQGARLLRVDAEGFEFAVAENLSKFRVGDLLAIGDGKDPVGAVAGIYQSHDPVAGVLRVGRDRQKQVAIRLAVDQSYCLDRRSFGLTGRLHDTVRAAFLDPTLRAVLLGEHVVAVDAARGERARAALGSIGLNASQVAAGTAAVAAESLCLVQGPPGTGKTRLLAEILALLVAKGCRIALTAFTHKAVDNALLALHAVAPQLAKIKLGQPGRTDAALAAAGVRVVAPRRQALPPAGVVVAGTCYAFAKLSDGERFHYAVFDEAGQLPIPHALVCMRLSSRWLFFGDHRQLPPVITERHKDTTVACSVFEFLHQRYGGHMLDVSYRMNAPLCRVIGELFYDGRLKSAPEAARRLLPFTPGGSFDWWLDPARPIVRALVAHTHSGPRSPKEAEVVAGMVVEAVRRHRLPPEEIGIVAPFRAQVREIRAALARRGLGEADGLTIDTVERIQGQQREMIVLSLALGDVDALRGRAAFFFSPQRLNVALSRARTKAIVVCAAGIFRALPMEPEALRAAVLFRRLERMVPWREVAGSIVPAGREAVVPGGAGRQDAAAVADDP